MKYRYDTQSDKNDLSERQEPYRTNNVSGELSQDGNHRISNDIAYTENCLKKLTKYEEQLYIFTDEEYRHDILELREGWEVVKHDETGQLYKAVRWAKDGISDITGEEHKKGDFKRMWEWISEKNLFSYHIEYNPRYKDAVFALNLQRSRNKEKVQ